MKNLAWIGTVIGMCCVACGDSSGSGGAGGTAGMDMGGAASGGESAGGVSAAGGGGAGGGGGASAEPQAPVMQSVEPLEGALHVMWMNVTLDCDAIELDRNKDGGAFTTAYTLAGQADSQHDSMATAPGTYCYKARCIKGDLTSPDSNEVCGTP